MKMIRLAKHPGRFFIDIAKGGCPCGCLYCYVDHIAGKETLLDEDKLAMLPGQIIQHPDFISGPHGTLLTFGTHSDLFRTPMLFDGFLSVLEAVAPLGNPIQISTKQFVRRDWASRIAVVRAYKTQLIIFVSCPTICQSALFEPKTASPSKRLASFDVLHTWDIPSCLYVKPFLPGITDKETLNFTETIRAVQPDAICVGSLYMNKQIAERLHLPDGIETDEKRTHPLMESAMGAIDPVPQFLYDLHTTMPLKPIFQNSACVVAYINKVHCPIHVWERFPQLCVECQDCRSLYQHVNVQEEDATAFPQAKFR